MFFEAPETHELVRIFRQAERKIDGRVSRLQAAVAAWWHDESIKIYKKKESGGVRSFKKQPALFILYLMSLFGKNLQGLLLWEGDVDSDSIRVKDTFVPYRDLSLDVGHAASRFRNAYIQGLVTTSLTAADATSIALNNHLVPNTDNTVNLGSAIKQYENVYAHNLYKDGVQVVASNELPTYSIPLVETLNNVALQYDDITLKVSGGKLYVASVATATGNLYAQSPLDLTTTVGGDPLMVLDTDSTLGVVASQLTVHWAELPVNAPLTNISGSIGLDINEPLFVDGDNKLNVYVGEGLDIVPQDGVDKITVDVDHRSIKVADESIDPLAHIDPGSLYVEPDELIFLGNGLHQPQKLADLATHTMFLAVDLA